MIKQTIKTLMMGGAMMVLPFMFTSCEDILGHWEKPTPSVEEMLTNLGAALEEGALVTITYTVDGVTYTSTFKKVGDEYVEQSTTNATRALTRASTSIKALIYYLGADNSYNFRAIEGETAQLNVSYGGFAAVKYNVTVFHQLAAFWELQYAVIWNIRCMDLVSCHDYFFHLSRSPFLYQEDYLCSRISPHPFAALVYGKLADILAVYLHYDISRLNVVADGR